MILNTMSYMRCLEITTRSACRVRCSYCPQEDLIRASKQVGLPSSLSMDTFAQCLEACPWDVRIIFAGFVEPWTNPACREMVLYTHDAGFSQSNFTTLAGLTTEDIDAIAHIPFAQFWVHLPERSSQMKISVDDEYLRVLDHLASSPIKNFNFHCHSPEPDEAVSACLDGRHPIQTWTLHHRAGKVDTDEVPEPIEGPLHCSLSPTFNHGVLIPNGDVHMCCQDYGLDHRMGTLLEDSYDFIFSEENPIYRQLLADSRRPGTDMMCRGCNFARPTPPGYAAAIWLRRVVHGVNQRLRA